MHTGRPSQRHAIRGLTRVGAAATVTVLAGCTLLAMSATAGTAGTVVVTPARASIYRLATITVTGTDPDPLSNVVAVEFNGVEIATLAVSAGEPVPTFAGTVALPAAGEHGAPACGANSVVIENPLATPVPTPTLTPLPLTRRRPARATAVPSPGPGVVATATLTAQCPVISVTPASFGRASEPAHVVVSGKSFPPRRQVALRIGHDAVGGVRASGTGTFRARVTVMRLGCATHQVEAVPPAVAGLALSASAAVMVTGCQRLALAPAVLQPGEVTHVTGTGFTPSRPVTLNWQIPGQVRLPGGSLAVTADGRGRISAYVLVLPNTNPGARKLLATQAGAMVTASAIVDAGSMQPSSPGQLAYRDN